MSFGRYLVGSPMLYAGTSGTATIGVGEVVVSVEAFATAASATLTIFGQPSGGIVIPRSTSSNPADIWRVTFEHDLFRATANSNAIVFTNTAQYAVHTVRLGGSPAAGGKL